jgi:hypothetical protein
MRPNQSHSKQENKTTEFARRVSEARREGAMFVRVLTNTGYFRSADKVAS